MDCDKDRYDYCQRRPEMDTRTVSSPLAELEAKDERISELESSVLVPGVLRCAKCHFQLTKKILCMRSGTVGSGDSKTEPCPNGCGPLWPVTWQQWATEMDEQAGKYFDGLKEAERRIAELEAKLATPVRLPNKNDAEFWFGSTFQVAKFDRAVERAIRAAGFTVEGDE